MASALSFFSFREKCNPFSRKEEETVKEYYDSCIKPQFAWVKRHKKGYALFCGALILIFGVIIKSVTTHPKEEN